MLSMEEINKFVRYWWFRYLMITEMYMVEKWEVVAIREKIKSKFGVYINHGVNLQILYSLSSSQYFGTSIIPLYLD